MTSLDPALQKWAAEAALPGGDVTNVRGLRDGGMPWLLCLRRDDVEVEVVLRIGDPNDASAVRTEIAALAVAAEHCVPAPRVLAVDFDGVASALLIEKVAGDSVIPLHAPNARLRQLGSAAASLHRTPVTVNADLPRRSRPIASVDFAALRRAQANPDPLLAEAETRVAAFRPDPASGFVHGDLWQGNSMWDGDRLIALIDWDCAGVGPAGVDLGSLRCDAALCFGLDAADDVRSGWEETAGRAAADVAYWDLVAALSTPPDLGWFVGAIGGQGRPDLTQEVLLSRRGTFVQSALDRLGRDV
jgi:aminoglycoside phosphotransferase (APT) family kinase protein